MYQLKKVKIKMEGVLLAPFFAFCFISCVEAEQSNTLSSSTNAVAVITREVSSDLIDRGRRLYIANCISCHNKDPNIKGVIGPEIIDSPLEVMTSKIMTGKYPDPLPAGYVPKRSTKSMKKTPKLQNDIPAIYAWVQSMKK
jgi:mono/diheme cytochrome c family protein